MSRKVPIITICVILKSTNPLLNWWENLFLPFCNPLSASLFFNMVFLRCKIFQVSLSKGNIFFGLTSLISLFLLTALVVIYTLCAAWIIIKTNPVFPHCYCPKNYFPSLDKYEKREKCEKYVCFYLLIFSYLSKCSIHLSIYQFICFSIHLSNISNHF